MCLNKEHSFACSLETHHSIKKQGVSIFIKNKVYKTSEVKRTINYRADLRTKLSVICKSLSVGLTLIPHFSYRIFFRYMALILSIDTSTTVCSVALHSIDNAGVGTLLGCYELFTERTSSAMLTTLISNVVHQAGFELSQIDAIAVAKGPGSYTGLRIGVSTAKGLCFALDKPLLAINTLAAMAEQIRGYYPADYLLCPMIDARRMEVYCAMYDTTGREVDPTSAKIINEGSFSSWLFQRPVVFVGDGAAKCRAMLSGQPNAVFPAMPVFPSARTVGQLALQAFVWEQFDDVAAFEPFYLKDFMAIPPKKIVL